MGDRLNMAYSSSNVTKGRGKGVLVFTGMETEIGKFAKSMNAKARKPGRSMSVDEGPRQGGLLALVESYFGKFLGLTVGTSSQIKMSKLAYVPFPCANSYPLLFSQSTSSM